MSLRPPFGRDESGFTLVEVLVATVVSMVILLAAFTLLEFSTQDVSRITDRAHADQTGRVALENIMLQLHSSCVAVGVNPIQFGSNENELKFISETSPLNTTNEPVSALPSVHLRKVVFNQSAGTLIEQSWIGKLNLTQTQESSTAHYDFNEAEKPVERVLLKGISRATTEAGTELPMFQYFRYYNETDHEPKYGQLNPVAFTPKSVETAEEIAKVTVNFSLRPEGTESAFAKGDRAVALEDSAILRLSPSSESPSIENPPCTQVVT
jgi:type II secretory pathway component PulJ